MSVAQKVVIPNAETWADAISPEHAAYLVERAVDPNTAVSAGLRTVTPDEGGQLLGFAWPLSSFGLLVPYPNVDGYARIRVDRDGKWLAPEAREVPIYITPGCQREGDAPLFVVEGPVKALAMANHGFNTVALGGVATTLTNERKLNDSWKDLALFHREVIVIFDANRLKNVAVARAEARLVLALEAAGARVRVVALPLRDGGGDQGPDDFLAAHGCEAQPLRTCVAEALPGDPLERAKGVIDKDGALSLLADLPFLLAVHERGAVAQEKVADLLGRHKVTRTLLREAVKAAVEGGKRAKVNAPSVTEYRVQDGRFCLVTSSGSNERVDPLCNFSANIVEDRTLDDGSGETSRVFVIEGALADGRVLERISVSPEELIGDLWPTKKWGSSVIVSATIPRAAHHLMNAIKALSKSVMTTAFGHTGFREHKGAFIFLHAGGAVGDDNVVVDLTGSAAKVVLPDAVVDPVGAVKTSLSALRVGVESITRPLHASVYRAPLNELLLSELVVDVYGKTGSLKSSTTAVFQSHFGDFDHASLPVSWEWTANAIETGLHRMKDVVAVIDDLFAIRLIGCRD
jgi:DNA polymerase-1